MFFGGFLGREEFGGFRTRKSPGYTTGTPSLSWSGSISAKLREVLVEKEVRASLLDCFPHNQIPGNKDKRIKNKFK